MSPVTAVGMLCLWILFAGLTAVYFETESVYCGVRVQKLLEGETKLLDELRREEMRYNKLVSPDVVEEFLRSNEELWQEYQRFHFPISDDENQNDLVARPSGRQ